MEQFASANKDKVKVIGVGTQDNQELAQSFQDEAKADAAQLVWSEDTAIWNNYAVRSQHATVLLDSSGKEIQRWDNFSASDIDNAL